MDAQERDMMLDSDTMRAEVLDAGLTAFQQLRNNGALAYILESAREDAKGALHKLIHCNAFDGEVVRRLQWEVQRYEALADYIRIVLVDAKNTADELDDETLADFTELLRSTQGDEGHDDS